MFNAGDVVSRDGGGYIGSSSTGVITEMEGVLVNHYGQDALGRESFDNVSTLDVSWKTVGNEKDSKFMEDLIKRTIETANL